MFHMGQASASDFLQNFGYITALLWSPKLPGVRFFSDLHFKNLVEFLEVKLTVLTETEFA